MRTRLSHQESVTLTSSVIPSNEQAEPLERRSPGIPLLLIPEVKVGASPELGTLQSFGSPHASMQPRKRGRDGESSYKDGSIRKKVRLEDTDAYPTPDSSKFRAQPMSPRTAPKGHQAGTTSTGISEAKYHSMHPVATTSQEGVQNLPQSLLLATDSQSTQELVSSSKTDLSNTSPKCKKRKLDEEDSAEMQRLFPVKYQRKCGNAMSLVNLLNDSKMSLRSLINEYDYPVVTSRVQEKSSPVRLEPETTPASVYAPEVQRLHTQCLERKHESRSTTGAGPSVTVPAADTNDDGSSSTVPAGKETKARKSIRSSPRLIMSKAAKVELTNEMVTKQTKRVPRPRKGDADYATNRDTRSSAKLNVGNKEPTVDNSPIIHAAKNVKRKAGSISANSSAVMKTKSGGAGSSSNKNASSSSRPKGKVTHKKETRPAAAKKAKVASSSGVEGSAPSTRLIVTAGGPTQDAHTIGNLAQVAAGISSDAQLATFDSIAGRLAARRRMPKGPNAGKQ
ncbi:hypothetical protein BDQ17DRAFT_1326273 [Cyathus striatus]|nr:hypothetical protein BDQ17DRAFT_1326273 [Cyathus striatus]